MASRPAEGRRARRRLRGVLVVLVCVAAARVPLLLLPDPLLGDLGGGLRLPVLPVAALCRLPRRDLTALLSLGQQLRAIDFAPFRRSVLSKRSVQAWLES